jgi:alpha-tubulin suppressor-like RCC1 family protein
LRTNVKKHFIVLLVLSMMMVTGCADEGGSGSPSTGGGPNSGTFLAISTGLTHTCGIDTSQSGGTLKCWGNNLYGQLGDGSQTDRLIPTAIDVGTVYSHVSVGVEHTCAITWSNSLKCWGRNNFGQLGVGSAIDSSVPVVVDAGSQYTAVSVGGNSSCGIVSSGQLRCWGYNGYGSLGDNTTANRNVPTDINVGTLYKTISMGAIYTCGTTDTDVLKCWGNNQYGQLGDGTTVNKTAPTVIDSGEVYKKISTSLLASFYTCGLTTAGKIRCWGANQYGQLGDGTTTTHSLPTAINTSKNYSDLSVGYVHTCAVEDLSGQLYCWGRNESGQLGDYTTTTRTSEVIGDTSRLYTAIYLGYNYTCGRTNKNLLRCWGRNDYGQIGDNSTLDVYYPKSIQ